MTRNQLPRTTSLVGALFFSSLAVLAACERTDTAQSAIETAGEKLEAQSIGAGSFYDKRRTKDLNEIVTSLGPILNDSDPGKSGAAAVLVARAKSGLGEIRAREASMVEHEFVGKAGVARALVDQWNSQHASAAAAGKYDPSKDLAELDKAIGAAAADAAKREADKAAQERVVTEIQARADAARSAAKRERDREAGIRKASEGQSQTAREVTIRQAVEASRAADAFDKQASELAAEAAKEQPKVTEINSDVERLHSHAEFLKNAKANIQQRADAARQQSTTAQHDADAVGKPLADSLTELAKLREDASTPALDAQKKYEEAASTVKKASTGGATTKENRTAAAAAQGAAKQSLGDLLFTRLRSLEVYRGTLDAVAKSTPPAPAASDAAKKVTELDSEMNALREQAKTAYKDAEAAYQGAGGTPETKKKLDDIAKALHDLANPPEPKAVPEAKPAAEAKPEVTKNEEMADAKPAAPALTPEQTKAVEDEVRATLRELAAATAAQDTDKLIAHIQTSSEQEKQVLLSGLPVSNAAKALDAACKAKWGKDLAGLVQDSKNPGVKGNPMFMMMGGMLGKGMSAGPISDADAAEKATIKAISLTEADVAEPDAPAPTRFKKEGDTWKVTGLGKALAGAGPMMQQILPMMKGMGEAFSQAAAGTTSGKYATADDMLTELSAKLMGAMGGMGGPGGGKPKPPGGG